MKYEQALWRTTLSFCFVKGCYTSVLFKYVDLIYKFFKFLKSCVQLAESKIKETTVSSGDDLFLISSTERNTTFFVY